MTGTSSMPAQHSLRSAINADAQETSGSEPRTVPSCHGGCPEPPRLLGHLSHLQVPCSAHTIAIRNGTLGSLFTSRGWSLLASVEGISPAPTPTATHASAGALCDVQLDGEWTSSLASTDRARPAVGRRSAGWSGSRCRRVAVAAAWAGTRASCSGRRANSIARVGRRSGATQRELAELGRHQPALPAEELAFCTNLKFSH